MSSNLKLTFKDVYTKVGEYLGIPNLTDAGDITKCKDLVYRGYRRFLMPIDTSTNRTYRWAFLNRTTTLSTRVGVDTYKLPIGFSAMVTPFTHTVPVSYNPTQKPLDFILLQKSLATGQGYPRYFAIKTGDYDALTGQTDEVLFYPVPSCTCNYYYTYVLTPPAPIEDDDVFIGCELASEIVLQCALAAAETFEKDGMTGQIAGLHEQQATKMIQAEIGEDKRQSQVGNIGQIRNGVNDFDYIRSASIYLTSTQIIPQN
jgi:hypothetical protein